MTKKSADELLAAIKKHRETLWKTHKVSHITDKALYEEAGLL